MNKYITVIFLCLFICSCDTSYERSLIESRKKVVDNTTGDNGMIEKAYDFTYKGHDYISFEGAIRKRGFSVVHSPECRKCTKHE